MSAPKVPPDFDELSTSEKIEYVQQLWDRIAHEVDSADLTDEQGEELDRRLQAHRETPDDVALWEDIRKRLRGEEGATRSFFAPEAETELLDALSPMSRQFADEQEAVLLAGYRRFFGEGYAAWSREAVQKCLHNGVSLDSPALRRWLRELERKGKVEFVDGEEVFVRVLTDDIGT
jgi:putative addiction module component (TIGR02574 family)